MQYLDFVNNCLKYLSLETKIVKENRKYRYYVYDHELEWEKLGGGVQRLLHILPDIYLCLYKGKSHFIHCIGMSLHPLTEYHFLLYLRKHMNERSATLEFTEQREGRSVPFSCAIKIERKLIDGTDEWDIYQMIN